MINLGGDIIKQVFGTASNTDLVNFHSRLRTFDQANEAIVHSKKTKLPRSLRTFVAPSSTQKYLKNYTKPWNTKVMKHFFNSSVGLTHSLNTMNLLPSRPTPYGRNPISSRKYSKRFINIIVGTSTRRIILPKTFTAPVSRNRQDNSRTMEFRNSNSSR